MVCVSVEKVAGGGGGGVAPHEAGAEAALRALLARAGFDELSDGARGR